MGFDLEGARHIGDLLRREAEALSFFGGKKELHASRRLGQGTFGPKGFERPSKSLNITGGLHLSTPSVNAVSTNSMHSLLMAFRSGCLATTYLLVL